jgi:hypothetical protein
MTRHRQKTNGSAKDILRCRSDLKLFNYQKSTVKDQSRGSSFELIALHVSLNSLKYYFSYYRRNFP